MEVKPGYKQTEVGVIPEEWEVFKLGDLIGYTKGFPFKSSEYQSSGIRVVRVSDTTYDSIKEEDPIFVSESSASHYATWQLKEHDLVISTVGSKPPMYDSMVGKVNLIDRPHENTLLNQNAVLIRDKKRRGYVQRLLLNHLRTKRYLLHIEAIYRGNANQASITLKELFQFTIPLPSDEPEQRAIATALSDADALLGGLDRLIAKKRDLKQAAMQQLLTGQTRLPGYHGEWEVKRLEQSCELITKGTTPTSMGRSFTESGVNFLKAESLSESGETIPDKVAFIDTATHKLLKRSQLKAGDLLISIAGVLGRVGRVSQGILPANTNQALAIVRLGNASELDRNFLFFCLRSPMTAKQISDVNVQAAQANISLQNVRDLEIHVPPTIPEQTTIAEVLTEMDAELAALTLRREKTHALKQAMMQELLTGRTRLLSPDAGTKTEVQR